MAEYDPAWPENAAIQAKRLRLLGPVLVQVHHIGSTSVPGLAAKPIIDLMPLVTSLAELDQRQYQIEELGYRWLGELGIPGRRYCSLTDENGVRLAQLHFFEAASTQVARHIAFRDYLRHHPEVAASYEAEKRRAQRLHPGDVHAYTDEKAKWVRETEAAALKWFERENGR